MNYENWCSRSYPGYIFFLVDQSKYMADKANSGNSFAEIASSLINKTIAEIAIRNTGGMSIYRTIKIIIICYGDGIMLQYNAYIDELVTNYSIPRDIVIEKSSDGCGGVIEIECERQRFITPQSSGNTNSCEAFRKVRNMILAQNVFKNKDESIYSPVPIIINVTCKNNIQFSTELINVTNSIKRIALPDGNPIICNYIIDAIGVDGVCFPTDNDLQGKESKIINISKVSSKIPSNWISALQAMGLLIASTGSIALVYGEKESNAICLFSTILFGGSEPYIHREH